MSPGAVLIACCTLLLMVGGAGSAQAGEEPWGGGLLWEDVFGQPDTVEIVGADGVAAGGGAAFIAGQTSDSAFNFDFLVRAYRSADGTLLWEDRYDRSGDDFALGVAMGHGRVFGLGGTEGFVGVPVIRAYDHQTGRLLWHDEVLDGQGVFDSAVVVGGKVIAVGGNRIWLVRAYDAASGALQWENRVGTAGHRIIGVAESDGRVFAVGRARPPGGPLARWWVRAYDAESGRVLWEDNTSAPPNVPFSQAGAVAVDRNRLVVAGRLTRSTPTGLNDDWHVRTYDTRTGELLWQDTEDKGGVGSPANPLDVTALRGAAFVAGSDGPGCNSFAPAPANCDFIVRTYETRTGEVRWEDRLDRAPADTAHSIAADDERVFAVGQGANTCELNNELTNCDLIIRAYDPKTGAVVWEDQVDHVGTDDAGQGVATHRGSVFAGGFFFSPDFQTADLYLRAYGPPGRGP